ncbi:maltose excess protein 1-like, chloroplastic [Musa acuminata AAA Group]|uniref:Maltose excess protein 1-like, chloroplastic n=1 Tax=Musa acuminata subsp. malaccensis TaxID=214687 RepID=A0A804IX17_MUSAM|nr:PREDICTED: maltose excess protein 1-like, chloroplastic isoform X2 [Musa acuminata subsp. malaccensis]
MAAAPPTLRLRPSLFSFRLSPPYVCPPLIPPPPSSQLVRAQTFALVPLRSCRITLNQFFSDPPHRRSPLSASSSDTVHPVDKGSKFHEWDSISAKFAGAANVPFLLLQLPQIVLNARNLLSGNNAALFAVPWLGMLTGLLGNLSLLSYFAKKKETEAVVVQTLGVVSTYAVIAQLAMAEAMPLPQFLATSIVVASGLILNCLNYFGWLHEAIWSPWEDFITIGGLAVLPQVMWSTFVPLVPNSILPGAVSFTLATAIVAMARSGKLSEKGTKFVSSMSGWTATLLFMWMPIAQMWTNYLNPDNIRGLSAFTMLLAMMGNGLMIPRALFIRDFMWFTGSAWASFLQGWGNLFCMYCFNTISREFFFGTTIGLLLWIGMVLWRDAVAYGYSSPLKSIKELIFAH